MGDRRRALRPPRTRHRAGNRCAGKDEAGKIHHGADDNASGTAAVLAIARAPVEQAPRDAMWCWPCGRREEIGLVGSSAFAAAPPVPIESHRRVPELRHGRPHAEQQARRAGDRLERRPGPSLWSEPTSRPDSTSARWPIRISRPTARPSIRRASPASSSRPALIPTTTGHPTPRTGSTTKIWIAWPRSAPRSRRPWPTRTAAGVHEGGSLRRTSGSLSGVRVTTGTIPDYTTKAKGLLLSGVIGGGPAETGGPEEGRHHRRDRWPVDHEHLRLHVRPRAAESRPAG